jgi:hypothetical protein
MDGSKGADESEGARSVGADECEKMGVKVLMKVKVLAVKVLGVKVLMKMKAIMKVKILMKVNVQKKMKC